MTVLMALGTRARVASAGVMWIAGLVGFRLVLAPPENCGSADAAAVEQGADAAAAWAITNLGPDGRFLYAYDRQEDRDSDAYNLVRHAGMTNALYQYVLSGQTDALEPADRSLGFMLERLVETGGGAAFTETREAKIGAAALLAAALMHRRDATGDETHDVLILDLGSFLVDQIEPRGSILAYWDRESGPVPDRYSPFGAGEATWALAMMQRRFPAAQLEEPVRLSVEYLATERDDREGYLWGVPDHWGAYTLAEMAKPGGVGLTEGQRDWARFLGGRFKIMARFEAQRSETGPVRITRGHTALGAGVGALAEGLNGLVALSHTDTALADMGPGLSDALGCVSDLLVRRQAGPDDVPPGADPDKVVGAWFSDSRTQMDDQQHALSGLLGALENLHGEDDSEVDR